MKSVGRILILFCGIMVMSISLANPIVVVPWSSPRALCDSVGDNLNPTFARGTQFYWLHNVMLWERNYGDHSVIFMKNFAAPDTEIAISPDESGIFATKPTASFIDPYQMPSRILIVWQSDENSNYDLYSAEFLNGQVNAYQRITDDPGDDLNPQIADYGLTWQRDSSIYYSEYSVTNSSWSSEVVLDSLGCSNPTISIISPYRVAYQKRVGNEYKVLVKDQTSSGNWNPPDSISLNGDNRFPQFSRGLPFSLIWQHRNNSDWNIMVLHEWINSPILFVYSSFNETNPHSIETPYLSKRSNLPSIYSVFENSMTGDQEIYANDVPGESGSIRNVSDFWSVDRHPALSEFSSIEADTLEARTWIAWERFQNGQWQIWGSHAETDLPGLLFDEAKQNPSAYNLFQNYPNPFNPNTSIGYRLSVKSDVELTVFNLLGQRVRELVNQTQPAGYYEVQWNGTDDFGKDVASGIYLYQLKTGKSVLTRKMLLLR